MSQFAAIINFCSNEARFIDPCLRQLRKITPHIIVTICDHLFNGEKENREKIECISSNYPTVRWMFFPFMPELLPKKNRERFLPNINRLVGFHKLNIKPEYLFFLDVDEIIDGDKFNEWVKNHPKLPAEWMKLACYWYFRSPANQAKKFEDNPLLVKFKKLKPSLLMHHDERDGVFHQGRGKKLSKIVDQKQQPLFHHYSWVRTKEEMLAKVKNWSHQKERNWTELVEKEFEGDFKGKDFIHGYTYKKVEPFASCVNFEFTKAGPSPIEEVTQEELKKWIGQSFISGPFERLKRTLLLRRK